jgi:hypothetical protein
MLGDPLAAVTSRTFSVLSQLRGKRIVHPHGVGCKGVLTPAGGPPYSFGTERRRVIARLSRSVGLPESLRDPCGIGLRILDMHGQGAHQDLLLVSSSRVPGGRHLLLPARDFASSHYSTLLPYRLGGGLVVLAPRHSTVGTSAPPSVSSRGATTPVSSSGSRSQARGDPGGRSRPSSSAAGSPTKRPRHCASTHPTPAASWSSRA